MSVFVHVQRNEIKKYADEGTEILHSAPKGRKGDSAIRKFLKVSTNEINIFLCHHFWGVDKELIWTLL